MARWAFSRKSDYDAPAAPVTIDPMNYRGPLFEMTGGQYWYFKWETYSSAEEAYMKCPPVAYIVNRKAQAFINGRTWVLNSQGKEQKTGEDAKKITKLMRHPNKLQSQKEFEAQGYIYQQLFGFNIILPIKPVGFTDNIDATSLWNIPASWIDIKATEERFTKSGGVGLSEIAFNYRGVKTVIAVADLIIIRDFTPSFNTLTFPGSKLRPLVMPINNIIGQLETENAIINNRGPQGIFTSDQGTGNYAPVAMTPDEKDDIQKELRRYGTRARQIQYIVTSAALKFQPIGSNIKDLALYEGRNENTKEICRGLNFPPFILGLADTTYNNMGAAEKGLYQNSVIPDAENYYEQLTTAFGLEAKNLWLNKDFASVPVMQEDKLTLAQARAAMNGAMLVEWENGLCTLDEWRIKNGEDPLPDGRGKLFKPEYDEKYGRKETQADPGTDGEDAGQPGEEEQTSQQ